MGTLSYSFGDARTPTQTYSGEATVDVGGDHDPYAHLADVADLPGHSDRPEYPHDESHQIGAADDPFAHLVGADDEPDGFSQWSQA